MKGIVIIGVLLIAVGLIGLLAGGISYTKDRDSAELGPIDITVEEKERVRIPQGLAIGSLAAGVILLVLGATRKRT